MYKVGTILNIIIKIKHHEIKSLRGVYEYLTCEVIEYKIDETPRTNHKIISFKVKVITDLEKHLLGENTQTAIRNLTNVKSIEVKKAFR